MEGIARSMISLDFYHIFKVFVIATERYKISLVTGFGLIEILRNVQSLTNCFL